MATTEPSPRQVFAAHAAGYERGLLPDSAAADCLYQHDAPVLRDAWFVGFSQGRTELAALRGAVRRAPARQ